MEHWDTEWSGHLYITTIPLLMLHQFASFLQSTLVVIVHLDVYLFFISLRMWRNKIRFQQPQQKHPELVIFCPSDISSRANRNLATRCSLRSSKQIICWPIRLHISFTNSSQFRVRIHSFVSSFFYEICFGRFLHLRLSEISSSLPVIS